MRFRSLFNRSRRSRHYGGPSLSLERLRPAEVFLEALESRIVPSGLPSPPTGLAIQIQNDDSHATPISDKLFEQDLLKIDNPAISGVAFQIDWKDIEPYAPINNPILPIQTQINWCRLDEVFQAANNASKKENGYSFSFSPASGRLIGSPIPRIHLSLLTYKPLSSRFNTDIGVSSQAVAAATFAI